MRKVDGELLRRLAGERPSGRGDEGGEGGEGGGGDHDRLAALWASLEPPAAAPPPPGFTGRVMARVRDAAMHDAAAHDAAARPDTLVRRFGVVPSRLAAGTALAAGLAAGAALGALVAMPPGETARSVPVAAAAAQGEVETAPAAGPLDDESLVAAAVAAAVGAASPSAAGEASDAAAPAAEPALADGYLAALSALEEAS
jgi:hypothetical protein